MTTSAGARPDHGDVSDEVPAQRSTPAGLAGAVSLLGFGLAAVSGFALTVVVGRGLGPAASGAFFSVVAVATVLSTIGKLGADTGVIWALSRTIALRRNAELGSVLRTALPPVAAVGVLTGAGVLALSPQVADALSGGRTEQTTVLLHLVVPFLVVGPVFAVLVAALRGFGDVVAFNVLQNVLVPVLRAVAAAVAVSAGWGLAGVMASWTAPPLLAAVLAAVLLRRRLARLMRGLQSRQRVADGFWRFSCARAVAAVLESLLVWSDVLLLTVLASPAEAGIYAAASRFITTGTLVDAALRVALAPRVSAAFALQDRTTVARLHAMATTWIVLLSWPLYLVLAVWSPFVLMLFGEDFLPGALPLTVLSLGMLAATAAGNSQTVLLMSGRSGLQVLDKTLSLLLNLSLCLVLVPRYGMLGAAGAWAATIALESGVVSWQVRYLLRVRSQLRPVLRPMLASVVCFALPAVVVRAEQGTTWHAALPCIAAGALAYACCLPLLTQGSLRSLMARRRSDEATSPASRT